MSSSNTEKWKKQFETVKDNKKDLFKTLRIYQPFQALKEGYYYIYESESQIQGKPYKIVYVAIYQLPTAHTVSSSRRDSPVCGIAAEIDVHHEKIDARTEDDFSFTLYPINDRGEWQPGTEFARNSVEPSPVTDSANFPSPYSHILKYMASPITTSIPSSTHMKWIGNLAHSTKLRIVHRMHQTVAMVVETHALLNNNASMSVMPQTADRSASLPTGDMKGYMDKVAKIMSRDNPCVSPVAQSYSMEIKDSKQKLWYILAQPSGTDTCKLVLPLVGMGVTNPVQFFEYYFQTDDRSSKIEDFYQQNHLFGITTVDVEKRQLYTNYQKKYVEDTMKNFTEKFAQGEGNSVLKAIVSNEYYGKPKHPFYERSLAKFLGVESRAKRIRLSVTNSATTPSSSGLSPTTRPQRTSGALSKITSPGGETSWNTRASGGSSEASDVSIKPKGPKKRSAQGGKGKRKQLKKDDTYIPSGPSGHTKPDGETDSDSDVLKGPRRVPLKDRMASKRDGLGDSGLERIEHLSIQGDDREPSGRRTRPRRSPRTGSRPHSQGNSAQENHTTDKTQSDSDSDVFIRRRERTGDSGLEGIERLRIQGNDGEPSGSRTTRRRLQSRRSKDNNQSNTVPTGDEQEIPHQWGPEWKVVSVQYEEGLIDDRDEETIEREPDTEADKLLMEVDGLEDESKRKKRKKGKKGKMGEKGEMSKKSKRAIR